MSAHRFLAFLPNRKGFEFPVKSHAWVGRFFDAKNAKRQYLGSKKFFKNLVRQNQVNVLRVFFITYEVFRPNITNLPKNVILTHIKTLSLLKTKICPKNFNLFSRNFVENRTFFFGKVTVGIPVCFLTKMFRIWRRRKMWIFVRNWMSEIECLDSKLVWFLLKTMYWQHNKSHQQVWRQNTKN